MSKHHCYCLVIAILVSGQFSSIASDKFGFTGQESIHSLGHLFLRNRFYDSETGAFLSRDPSGVQGGLNAYSYVSADPVNHTDPLGLAEVGVAFDPLLGSSANHAFSWVRENNGRLAWIYEARPSKNAGSTLQTAINLVGLSADFGYVQSGFAVQSMDSLPSSRLMSATAQQIVVSDDLPASHYISKLDDYVWNFEKAQLKYNAVYGPNSNTFIKGALNAIGITSYSPPVNAPGWSKPLTIPAKTESQNIFYLGTYSGLDQSGVLIDKAAELVGSNLADIKGATYDPVSNQIIFLGSNSTPGAEGIDMEYFFTAVQAVYGSAIPPYVSLDAPASASSLWQDLGDGDGSFEAGEWGGFSMRYNPLWSEEDGTVAVRVKCSIGATNYDFTVNFSPQMISWLEYPNGQKPMHLVYASITGTAPPKGDAFVLRM